MHWPVNEVHNKPLYRFSFVAMLCSRDLMRSVDPEGEGPFHPRYLSTFLLLNQVQSHTIVPEHPDSVVITCPPCILTVSIMGSVFDPIALQYYFYQSPWGFQDNKYNHFLPQGVTMVAQLRKNPHAVAQVSQVMR